MLEHLDKKAVLWNYLVLSPHTASFFYTIPRCSITFL